VQIMSSYQGGATIPDSVQGITGGVLADGTGMTYLSGAGVQNVGLGSGSSSPSNGNSLSILSNQLATTVTFPALTAIGGSLVIGNNSGMTNINGFGELASVGGNVDLSGDFQSVSLPALTSVGGGVNIQSSNPNFQCPISDDRTNGVIKGKGFVCAGNIKDAAQGVTGANFSANTFSPGGTSGGNVGLSGVGLGWVGVLEGLIFYVMMI
jgi:hypothetical protein